MNSILRQQLVVLLAAGVVFFTRLGGPTLWDEDEPKNAQCAREMLERNDWVVPTFNGQLRTDKPILLYWLMRCAYAAFSVSEFSARFTSALLAVGTVLLTYHLGRLLFRSQVGLWAGLVLSGALMFDVSARAATPDATLIFCTTLALFLFAKSSPAFSKSRASESYLSWGASVLVYAAMGLAVLAKGPTGAFLPMTVIAVFLLSVRALGQRQSESGAESESTRPPLPPLAKGGGGDVPPLARGGRGGRAALRGALVSAQSILRALAPRHLLAVAWALRPLTAIVVIAAIAIPWYAAVGYRTEGQWLVGFLGTHHVGRFLNSMEGHGGPVFYYLVTVMLGMLPWSVFLPHALARVIARLRQNAGQNWGDLFLLCWAGVYVAFFSLAQTKLPNYVLPCYPALAVMIGRLIDGWLTQPEVLSRRAVRIVLGLGCAAGFGFCIALPITASFVLPGEYAIGLAGLIPLAGFGLALYFVERDWRLRGATTFAVTAVLFATTLFGVVACRVDRHQSSAELVELVRQTGLTQPGSLGGELNRPLHVATFDYFRPSLVFYAKQPVPVLETPQAVAEFLRSSPDACLITRSNKLDLIQHALPPGIEILHRRRMFLRRHHDVLLLGRRPVEQAARLLGPRDTANRSIH